MVDAGNLFNINSNIFNFHIFRTARFVYYWRNNDFFGANVYNKRQTIQIWNACLQRLQHNLQHFAETLYGHCA